VATHKCYPKVLSVDVDDLAVGREAAEALSMVGFKSLACLGNGTPYSNLRIQGFKDSISSKEIPFSFHTESGFEELRYSESFTEPSKDMKDWLETLPKPCGIFAVHDPLGRFLSGACGQLGIGVPDEVAIVGANNDPLVCGLTFPMLSSVSIPWDEVGKVVGMSMQKMILGQQLTTHTCKLISPSGVVLRHSANHLAIQDNMLRRSMSYMTERVKEAISIGTLCNHLNISRRTLERKFKEVLCCTPWEMLCQIRVNQAKQLLVETVYPISRVAELSGFNDPERMAVVFKRLTGKSPSQFRK
jgi:LacI family transcriptional regulator